MTCSCVQCGKFLPEVRPILLDEFELCSPECEAEFRKEEEPVEANEDSK